MQRKKRRRMDTEGGLLDGSVEESWDGGIISRSVQETILPIVGDSRLRFDRDQGTATEEGLDGEEGKGTGPGSPAAGCEVVDPPPSPCSAVASSADVEGREDEHSSDCDSLVRDQVDTRTGSRVKQGVLGHFLCTGQPSDMVRRPVPQAISQAC